MVQLLILLLIGLLAEIPSAYPEVIEFNMSALKSNTYQKVQSLESETRFTILIHSKSSLINHTLYCIDHDNIPSIVFVDGYNFNETTTTDEAFVIDDYLKTSSDMQTTWECTINNSRKRPIIKFNFYLRVHRTINSPSYFDSYIPTKLLNNPTYNNEVYGQKYQTSINSKIPQYINEEQYAPTQQTEPPNQEKNDTSTSIPSSNAIIVIVGVICLLQTLTLVVYLVYKKHCGRKQSIERTGRQEARSNEHVYEDLDYPVAMNIINRPPHPLPPQEREENFKYNTPYDHRIIPPNRVMHMTPRTFKRI